MTSPGVNAAGVIRQGVIAGTVATVVFSAVHHVTISNIWGALPPMVVAGALCGACIAWTFARLVRPTIAGWVAYNATYLAILAGLMIASLLVFEPVTTMAEVLASPDPVGDLLVAAAPLTAVFTVVSTAVVGLVLARVWKDYLRILLTVTTLIVTLGANVSVVGLVDMTGGSLRPLVLFLALIALLDVAFALTFAVLRWPSLSGGMPDASGRRAGDWRSDPHRRAAASSR